MVHGAPVHRLRGRLLPLVYLDRELGGKNAAAAGSGSTGGDAVNIVVLQADDRQFGLVVDQINDTEEIVVKPLGKQLKGVSAFAGATIMGDGKVALILDAMGLAQRSGVINEVRERMAVEKSGIGAAQAKSGKRQTLLLFQPGASGRMAVPLSLVARLEEFDRAKVELAGRQEVVQYRGQILPLVQIAKVVLSGSGRDDDAAPAATAAARLPLQVVVYTEHGRSVGLVVERILDIVEQEITLEHPARHNGLLGSLLVQQRVTDLLDVESVVRSALPSFFENGKGKAVAAGS
jgi:two-component system chemotaxis sensor kinase CheA